MQTYLRVNNTGIVNTTQHTCCVHPEWWKLSPFTVIRCFLCVEPIQQINHTEMRDCFSRLFLSGSKGLTIRSDPIYRFEEVHMKDYTFGKTKEILVGCRKESKK